MRIEVLIYIFIRGKEIFHSLLFLLPVYELLVPIEHFTGAKDVIHPTEPKVMQQSLNPFKGPHLVWHEIVHKIILSHDYFWLLGFNIINLYYVSHHKNIIEDPVIHMQPTYVIF